MDYFTVVNLGWFVVCMAAVLINWRQGYRQGVIDTYTSTTVPVVDMLMSQGYISAKQNGSDAPVDANTLAQHLVRMAAQRNRPR